MKKQAKLVLALAEATRNYFDRVLAGEEPKKVGQEMLASLDNKVHDSELHVLKNHICRPIEKCCLVLNKAREKYSGVGQGYRKDLMGEKEPDTLKLNSFLRAIFPKGIPRYSELADVSGLGPKIEFYPFAIGIYTMLNSENTKRLFGGSNGFTHANPPTHVKNFHYRQDMERMATFLSWLAGDGPNPGDDFGESELEVCLNLADKNLESGAKSPSLMALQPFTFFVNCTAVRQSEEGVLLYIIDRRMCQNIERKMSESTSTHELRHVIDKFLDFTLLDITGEGPYDCRELSARLYTQQKLRSSCDFREDTGKEQKEQIKEAYKRCRALSKRFDPKTLSYVVSLSKTAQKVNENLELLRTA